MKNKNLSTMLIVWLCSLAAGFLFAATGGLTALMGVSVGVINTLYYGLTGEERVVYNGANDKPIIYVYNDTDEPNLSLFVHTSDSTALDITYPVAENNTWVLSADENSNITVDGREYNYLYWEDRYTYDIDITEGYCVKGEDTIEFLEYALTKLGLTEKEQDDFITYWLPRMYSNKYNIITFNPDAYFEEYKHEYSRPIDHELVVFMAYAPSDTYVEIPEQDLGSLTDTVRGGLTIVEWGGTELERFAQ